MAVAHFRIRDRTQNVRPPFNHPWIASVGRGVSGVTDDPAHGRVHGTNSQCGQQSECGQPEFLRWLNAFWFILNENLSYGSPCLIWNFTREIGSLRAASALFYPLHRRQLGVPSPTHPPFRCLSVSRWLFSLSDPIIRSGQWYA